MPRRLRELVDSTKRLVDNADSAVTGAKMTIAFATALIKDLQEEGAQITLINKVPGSKPLEEIRKFFAGEVDQCAIGGKIQIGDGVIDLEEVFEQLFPS